VNVRVKYAHSFSLQGEGGGKVHGYGAFAYSAFSAYHGDFVLNLAHSDSEDLLLFQHLFPEYFAGVYVFWRAHKNPKLSYFECSPMFKVY